MQGSMKGWLILLVVSAMAAPVAAQLVVRDGFEEGLEAWTVGSDLPDDPNTSGKVAAEVAVQADTVFSGERAARLYIDGRQDDGTIWIARQVDTRTADQVSLSFRFWSPFKDSFNNLAYVVAYIGPEPPRSEGDFARLAPVTDVGEWDRLELSGRTDGADTTWVAVGFSVVWESEQTYYLDEVAVERRQTDPPTAVQSASWGAVKDAAAR